MSQQQLLARAGQTPRVDVDTFDPPGSRFKYLPSVFEGDGAQPQVGGWKAVFPAEEMRLLKEEVEALREEYRALHEQLSDEPIEPPPLFCKQNTIQLEEPIRGTCQFHLSNHLKTNRAQLFDDYDNVKLVQDDLGRLSKELAFEWLKPIAMSALIDKWSAIEPRVATWLEGYIEQNFTYVEMNSRVPGGIPNTNVAQEGKNK